MFDANPSHQHRPTAVLSVLKEAFMLFDYNKDGKIFTQDVGPVIRSIGLKPSEAEVKSIVKDVEQAGLYGWLAVHMVHVVQPVWLLCIDMEFIPLIS